MIPLEQADQALLEAARSIIRERFREGFHEIGAALRTRGGQVYRAVHLEANVGRVAVCAEAVAIGMAAAAGDTDIETIVAVDRLGNLCSPCGMCRELISDYSPGARVIVPSSRAGGGEVVSVSELLPVKYRRMG